MHPCPKLRVIVSFFVLFRWAFLTAPTNGMEYIKQVFSLVDNWVAGVGWRWAPCGEINCSLSERAPDWYPVCGTIGWFLYSEHLKETGGCWDRVCRMTWLWLSFKDRRQSGFVHSLDAFAISNTQAAHLQCPLSPTDVWYLKLIKSPRGRGFDGDG